MDWIKLEKQTPKKGEVVRIAARLGISRDSAFAKCVEFWMWADGETRDGVLDSYTREMVDLVVDCKGFAEALIAVDWLRADDRGLIIPNFERHMSDSAKKRALKARRMSRYRQQPEDENDR